MQQILLYYYKKDNGDILRIASCPISMLYFSCVWLSGDKVSDGFC